MERVGLSWEVIPYGLNALNVRLFDQPSSLVSQRLAYLAKELEPHLWVHEVVIGFCDLVIYSVDNQHLDDRLQLVEQMVHKTLLFNPSEAASFVNLHRIPVRYNGADLPHVAQLTGLEASQVVSLHTAQLVTVSVMGFRPFFGYCLGVDQALSIPRKSDPSMVQAGAVALAAGMTAIYPDAGPGGWHVIGHCDPSYCRSLAVGDRIAWEALP